MKLGEVTMVREGPRCLVSEYLQGVVGTLRNALPGYAEVVAYDLTVKDHTLVAATGPARYPERDKRICDWALTRATKEQVGGPDAVVVLGGASMKAGAVEWKYFPALFFNERGSPSAIFVVCVNTTVLESLERDLRSFLPPRSSGVPEQETRASAPSIGHLFEDIAASCIAAVGTPVARMSKPEKMSIVKMMNEKGLFLVRGSVDTLAERLNISRYTMYNYFDELGINRS